MDKITWELPFKSMHYLDSLTSDLAEISQIILLTAFADVDGNVDSVNITLRDVGQSRDNTILTIGAIIGAHSVGYSIELKEQTERDLETEVFIKEILDEEEEALDFNEIFQNDIDHEQNKEEAPHDPQVENQEEEVEKVIEEIVKISPVSKKKDSSFIAKLRVILNNYKK
jgi:hypothetical protein